MFGHPTQVMAARCYEIVTLVHPTQIPVAMLSLVLSQLLFKKHKHVKGHPPHTLMSTLPAFKVQLVKALQPPVMLHLVCNERHLVVSCESSNSFTVAWYLCSHSTSAFITRSSCTRTFRLRKKKISAWDKALEEVDDDDNGTLKGEDETICPTFFHDCWQCWEKGYYVKVHMVAWI